MSVFSHLEFDAHEEVNFCFDKHSGLRAIIAVHDTSLGPSLGGCRMFPYANADEALTDVLRLAKGMSYKAALANLPMGGGKSVIIGDPRQHKSREKMLAMGRFVDSMQGRYIIAEDSGMSVKDVTVMSEHTAHVGGISAHFRYDGEAHDGNPAPATAYGVFKGIEASVQYRFNSDLAGIRVAVQGVGQVGSRLVEHLHHAGAHIIVADAYAPSVDAIAHLERVTVGNIDSIHAQGVDVFAPCALGATINKDTIDQIQAKVIAGAANNQLATDDLGQVLLERDIIYAPDYVINAGGIIDIHHQTINSSSKALRLHLDRIGETLVNIYAQSQSQHVSTNNIASQIGNARMGKCDPD